MVNRDGEGDVCDIIADRPAASGVSDLTAVSARDRISLTWTNPPGFIAAFNISWHEVETPDRSGFKVLTSSPNKRIRVRRMRLLI